MTFALFFLAATAIFVLISNRIMLGRIAHALEVIAKITPEQEDPDPFHDM